MDLTHISFVLKWSGIKESEYRLIRIVSWHIFWVLRRLWISFIQLHTNAYKDMFVNALQPSTSIGIRTENK